MHTAKKPLGRCDFCKHWRCPICRTPTTIGALRFDPFTDDIIKNNPGLRRVKVTRSKGTYAPALDEDARGDDDAERIDDARAVRPASNGKGEADGDGDDTRDGDATRGASGPEVIELSDASDEETDSAAAAPARGPGPAAFSSRALPPGERDGGEDFRGVARAQIRGVLRARGDAGKAESGLMDHLEKTLRDVYAMTKTLDHEDRDSLSAIIAAHKTGERFQKFRRLVKDNRLEASPLGNRLRVVLTLMSHSRDHWKAVIRKTEIPPPMKEPSTEQAAKSEKGKAATNAASGSKKRESAEGAPSPVTTKKAKNAVASMTTKTATEKTDEDAGGGGGGFRGDRAGEISAAKVEGDVDTLWTESRAIDREMSEKSYSFLSSEFLGRPQSLRPRRSLPATHPIASSSPSRRARRPPTPGSLPSRTLQRGTVLLHRS